MRHPPAAVVDFVVAGGGSVVVVVDFVVLVDVVVADIVIVDKHTRQFFSHSVFRKSIHPFLEQKKTFYFNRNKKIAAQVELRGRSKKFE